jgi:hypothetical protein
MGPMAIFYSLTALGAFRLLTTQLFSLYKPLMDHIQDIIYSNSSTVACIFIAVICVYCAVI